MTIGTTTSSITYQGNNATTVFSFPFVADSASDLIVTYTNTAGFAAVLSPSVYTVALNATPVGGLWGIGGTVTYPNTGSPPVPAPVGTLITIQREVPYEQTVSISNQGAFYPQVVEQGLDILELQVQQVETDAEFSLKFPIAGGVPPTDLPGALQRENTVLGFDSTGAVTLYPTNPVTPPVVAIPVITFLDPVTSQVAAPTGAESVGTRYLVKNGTGTFSGKNNQVAQLTVTGWLFSAAPQNNQTLEVGVASYVYAYADDLSAYVWRAVITRRIKWAANQNLVLEGDSIAVGQAASSHAVNGFGAIISNRYNMFLQNNGVGGKSTYQALISSYAAPSQFYTGSWPNGNRNAYLYEGGHNDCLYAATSPVLTQSVAGNDLTWWTKCCAKTAIAASALSLSGFSGTIGGVLCMASAQLSGNGKLSATPGDTISGSFTGDNIVVWSYASDGTANRMSPFTLTVDGTVVLTYNGDGQYDACSLDGPPILCPRAVVYRGAGAGSHTFVITVLAGPGIVYIDSVGTLLEPNRAPECTFLLPPRPLIYALGPGNSSPAVFEAVDNARQQWIKDYAEYPIAVARPMDWLTTNNYNVDGEHPNTAGHLQIAESIELVAIGYGDYDDANWTPSVNAWTITGGYSMTATYERIGRRVFVEYVFSPNAGTNFTTSAGVSNVSLVGGLTFFSLNSFAQVMNITDQVSLGVGLMKSDGNGGGIYLPAINVTNKIIGISGSYVTY